MGGAVVKFLKPSRSKLKAVSSSGKPKNSLIRDLHRVSDQKRQEELAKRGADPFQPTTKLTIRKKTSAPEPPQSNTEEAKKIRGMRKFYNKMMPSPQCNSCAMATNCPQFRAGYECAFLPFLNAHGVETVSDLREYMKELLGSNLRRAHQAVLMETLSGAPPSLELSEQLALLFGQLKELFNLETEAGISEVTLETGDASIIGKLFGGMDQLVASTEKALKAPIDVPALVARSDSDSTSSKAYEEASKEVLEDFVRDGNEKLAKGLETVRVVKAKIA